jgi:hypothetical protein
MRHTAPKLLLGDEQALYFLLDDFGVVRLKINSYPDQIRIDTIRRFLWTNRSESTNSWDRETRIRSWLVHSQKITPGKRQQQQRGHSRKRVHTYVVSMKISSKIFGDTFWKISHPLPFSFHSAFWGGLMMVGVLRYCMASAARRALLRADMLTTTQTSEPAQARKKAKRSCLSMCM